MALPITIPQGTVLIYGFGYETGWSGVVPSNTNIRFGTVYEIWSGGATFIYTNDKVFWKDGDEICKLTYAGSQYTLIPCRLVTEEIFAP